MNSPRHTAKRPNRPAVEQPRSRRAREHGTLRPVDWALIALIVAAIAVTAVMAIFNPA